MNFEIKKSNIRGNEEVSITIWPSDNLETEYFNAIFSGEVEVVSAANGEQRIIRRKKEDIEIQKEEKPLKKKD